MNGTSRRLVIFVTDAPFHVAGDGKVGIPIDNLTQTLYSTTASAGRMRFIVHNSCAQREGVPFSGGRGGVCSYKIDLFIIVDKFFKCKATLFCFKQTPPDSNPLLPPPHKCWGGGF